MKKVANLSDAMLMPCFDGLSRLVGYVYNHPEFATGEYIRTSPVIENNNDWSRVETMDIVYNVAWKKGFTPKKGKD